MKLVLVTFLLLSSLAHAYDQRHTYGQNKWGFRDIVATHVFGTHPDLAAETAIAFVKALGAKVTGPVESIAIERSGRIDSFRQRSAKMDYSVKVPTDLGVVPLRLTLDETLALKEAPGSARAVSILISHRGDITDRTPDNIAAAKHELASIAEAALGPLKSASFRSREDDAHYGNLFGVNATFATFTGAKGQLTYFVREDQAGLAIIGMMGDLPDLSQHETFAPMTNKRFSLLRGDASFRETPVQWLERVGALGHHDFHVTSSEPLRRGDQPLRALDLRSTESERSAAYGELASGRTIYKIKQVTPTSVSFRDAADDGSDWITISFERRENELFPVLRYAEADAYGGKITGELAASPAAGARRFLTCEALFEAK